MRTLRARVLTVAVVGLVVTVGLLTTVTAWLAYERSLQVLDEDLERQLVHLLAEAADAPLVDVLADEPPASRVASYLVAGDGRILAHSRGPEDVDTAARATDLSAARTLTPTNIPTGDTRLRAVAQQVDADSWIVVAGEYDAVRAQAWQFAGLVASVGVVCLLAGGLGTSLALSRAVRPVHDLATETSKLPPDDLRPVAVPDGPQEVVALATELNALLSRVRSEAARRNRFLATLSHEMRTPLTVARGQLELLALYGPRDPADAEQTAAVAAAEVVRAASMLDAFLNLARSQEPGFVAPTPQYLPVLAADLRMRLSAMPEVTVAEPPAITVPVDPERIAQAVLNCVTNALRAADTVIVAMEHGSQWLTISVDDNGPGWPADKHALLRPFTSASGSSGLGLAVVQAIAEAHGGNVELVDSALGGARVEIQVAAQ